MKPKRIFRITEDQLNGIIYNTENPSDTPEYGGQRFIKPDGYIEPGENGNPSTTDQYANMICPQMWGRYASFSYASRPTSADDCADVYDDVSFSNYDELNKDIENSRNITPKN